MSKVVFENSKEIDWGKIPVFLALVREGTLTGAARRLAMVPSSVSRQIDELEHSLGSRLFERTPRGYLATPAATELVTLAESVEISVGAFSRMGRGHDDVARGSVRLATAENFATRLILPRVAPFLARHPQLRLEIVTDVRSARLSRREADIALRLIRPSSGPYIISKLAEMESGIFGSRQYLAGDRSVERIVTWDDRDGELAAAQWLRQVYPEARVAITTTTLAAQVAAAQAGAGLAALPLFVAEGLERVGHDTTRQPVWLVQHSDSYRTAAILAVADFVRECAASARLGD